MQGELVSPASPVLDEETKSFVRRALGAGLVEIDDLKKVVVSLLAESDEFSPRRLADGLVGAGFLTRWQSSKLLAGRSRGFYLGSYRLLRPLGKGGMGVVYLGEHHVMKRVMALKILPPEASADKRRIERFQAEARACAQLDHPNIVRAYDFAEAGGKLYIVMEYVDGIDLHKAVQRDGVMSIADAIDALRQSAEGLSHAHERGVIHRDIKPSNLLMRTDGMVKVSDLGLARIGWGESESDNKRMMGTADFISPEQAQNCRQVDSRSDIYSLGCTLYYLLVGRPPFSGTATQRLAKHQTAPVPDIRNKRPDCPNVIAELAMRMMAKRPQERPTSAVELLAQLNRLTGLSNQAVPQRERHVAPAGETVVDEAVYQATIDDTSLSPDSSVDVGFPEQEFDFANLPPVEVPKASPPQSTLSNRKQTTKPPNNSTGRSSRTGDSSPTASYQNVMLGVGLTLAVLALIAVVGIGVIALTQPLQSATPGIKSLEDGKGGKVIIVP